MYNYQCSRQECGNSWSVEEGCLNGFSLICPVCEKGRGLFVSQSKCHGEDKKEVQKSQVTVQQNAK